MYDSNKAYDHFLADKLAEELFQTNAPDPFNKRLRNIRSWEDVRYDGGLSRHQCNPQLLREGYMSQALHDYFVSKIGEERLKNYFGDAPKPKLSKTDEELNELSIRLFGTVSEINALNARKQK